MIKTVKAHQSCPCSSGVRYGDCCRPWHKAGRAPDAVTLMRSRYAAFAMGDVAYLDATQHPEHIDQAHPEDERRRRISAFCRAARFPGLKIVDSGNDGDDALVLFVARVFVGRDDDSFVECSRFRKYQNEWRYLEGDLDDDVAACAAFKTVASFLARPKTSTPDDDADEAHPV